MIANRGPETRAPESSCGKCGNGVHRLEKDPVGIIRTCVVCGHCTYMDRDGQVTEEQEQLEKKIVTAGQETRETEIRAPGITAAVAPDAMEFPGETDPVNKDGEVLTAGPGTTPKPEALAGDENTAQPEALAQDENTAEPEAHAEDENTGEPGPTAKCAECNSDLEAGEYPRFRRFPLRQCPECGQWEINPEYDREITGQGQNAGAVLQMSYASATLNEINESLTRLLDQTPMKNSAVQWRIKRYAPPAVERMRNTPVQSGKTWAIDGMHVRRGRNNHWCWAIVDVETQYILATGITERPEPEPPLFELAKRTSGITPDTTLIDPKPGISPSRIKKELPGVEVIRTNSSNGDPDGSLARLRRTAANRAGKIKGQILPETMGNIFNPTALSINFFEESELLGGRTPAEAAGVEAPYTDWTDLVEKETRGNTEAEHTKMNGPGPATESTARPAEHEREAPATEPTVHQMDGEREAPEIEPAEEPAGRTGIEKAGEVPSELREILDRLATRQETLFHEYQETVKDRRAVERTIELLSKNS